jgi:SAM-dependent methyltransferase
MSRSSNGSSDSATEISYQSSELEVFANALNWKQYWASVIRPYVKGRVLEVGAGLAGSTDSICDGSEAEWCCLEPDLDLCDQIRARIETGELPANCRVQPGVLADLPATGEWDAILYIDVLEHIEDDANEVRAAAARLAPGGTLTIVSPAHAWLFSPFDAAVGHFRRYDRASLLGIMPSDLDLVSLKYLDSVGVLLSLANRMLLRSPEPSHEQIGVWDRFVVPVSRRLDPLLGYRLGKTIVGAWRKASTT